MVRTLKRSGLVRRRNPRVKGVVWESVKQMILEGLSAEQIGRKVGLCGVTIGKYTKIKFPHLVETLSLFSSFSSTPALLPTASCELVLQQV